MTKPYQKLLPVPKKSVDCTAKPTKVARRIQVRRSGVHGKGVFAMTALHAGERLIEYTGELITWPEALRRHPHDSAQPHHTFYFHIDDKRVIDAKFGGNSSRWINHSCVPNCTASQEGQRMYIDALRDIAPGEELFYDYGLVIDEPLTAALKADYPCWCGHGACRGTLLANHVPTKKPRRARSKTTAVHPMPLSPATCLASLNKAAETVWPGMAETLAAHPAPMMAGFTVEVLPSIDSTNAELMRRARSGPDGQAPTLLVAAHQTAGRGRMGKPWLSQPGHSLTFSLLLPLLPSHWAGLSLAVGVSLVDALCPLLSARVGDELRLKWPNDLWLQGAKLAGILVETAHLGSVTCVVVGVGINIETPVPDPIAAWTGVPPTSLSAHQGGLDSGTVLVSVAPALLRDLLAFETLGFSAFAQRFARYDVLRDQALILSDGTQGTGCGVNEQGALQVLTSKGLHTVHSAEVSVRPAKALT